jgi:hypothetical protein
MVQTAVLEPKVSSDYQQKDHDHTPEIQRIEGPITVLSSSEVAWLLGTDVTTIDNWVNAGIIKPCRNSSPGDKRFRREDIAALLANIGV